MIEQDKKFMQELLQTFQNEAKEHIQTLTNLIISLENEENEERKSTIVENAFREVHSLKGASRAVGKKFIELLCKGIESIFAVLKKELIPLEASSFETLHLVLKLFEKLTINEESDYAVDVTQCLEKLDLLEQNIAKKGNSKEIKPKVVTNITAKNDSKQKEEEKNNPDDETTTIDNTKVSVEKLISLMRNIEEFLYVKQSYAKQINYLEKNINTLMTLKKYNTDKDILEEQLKILEDEIQNQKKEVKGDSKTISKMIDTLLDESKKLLLFPFSTLLEFFPKVVYDLAAEQNKKIDFSYSGSELEIDRRILDKMKDPLMHILRNSIDHGIEDSEIRKQKNKPEKGKIIITIKPIQNSKIKIDIKDDGAGIDVEKLKKSVVKQKIYDEKQLDNMNKNQLENLIFYSGITTKDMVTNLSGRGLGLAIAKEKAQKLGGDIFVNNEEKEGTSICIILPMIIATYQGVLIRQGLDCFIIPVSNVVHTFQLFKKDIKTIENRSVIFKDEEMLPLFWLDRILNLEKVDHDDYYEALILQHDKSKIVLVVDRIKAEVEILTKSLGKQLLKVKYISGCTILPDNEIALILNIADITTDESIKSVLKTDTKTDLKSKKTKLILMVDDSLTTRTLMKNIFEISGYDVILAVDGVDAYEKLLRNPIDLVVTDVDMPNMNGFELTSKIKNNKKYEDTPVILLTSLETKEDKQKGLEAGADAYIVKSTFEQNNLLETIGWMI